MTTVRDVCVCPVRQFNVQLYVEKVFIAQKTSDDRGGKVRKREEIRGGVVGTGSRGRGIGGEGGVEGPKEGKDSE